MVKRWMGGGLVVLLLLIVGGPREAAAQCPWDNEDFLGPCGPSQALPPWGNTWSRPEYYSTITTGDVDGDGAAELLGRSAVGIEVHKFDPHRGQWRPFFDATDQFILTEFADVPGSKTDDTPWDQVQYHATIRLADIDGDGAAEVLGRGKFGVIVLKYYPGTDGAPGTWKQKTSGVGATPCKDEVGNTCMTPFPDSDGWDHVQYYSTIHLADVDGKPGAELLARGSHGIWTYRWTTSCEWQLISRLTTDFTDELDWNEEQYYSTIQYAKIDKANPAMLLARAAAGMWIWTFDATTRTWSKFAEGGPFSDHEGWAHPQYYLTIQTADIDGDGAAELLGRSAEGIWAYRWTGSDWKQLARITSEFTDHEGWAHPQYYSTIQFADIDGDTAAELLARRDEGMILWSYDGSSNVWSQAASLFDKPGLIDSYTGEAFGQTTTMPLWNQPHYYATIQTANIDGDQAGAQELLARGSFGMRTWRLDTTDPTNPTWTRYRPYGYPDPAFPAGGLLDAYNAVNTLLEPSDPSFDIRGQYNLETMAPLNTTDLDDWQSTIADTCQDQMGTTPPQYQICTPPSGSGVDHGDWTTVANEIIAELFYATQLQAFHDQLSSAQSDVFVLNNVTFSDIATDLELDEESLNAKGGAAYLALYANIVKTIGAVASVVAPEIAPALNIFGNMMGSIASALPGGTSFNPVAQTYAEVQNHITQNESRQDAVVDFQFDFVRGDLPLLITAGELVSQPRPEDPIWRVDAVSYKSGARQGFALWLYQIFLPVIWDKWVITECKDKSSFGSQVDCFPPADGDYMATYEEDGIDFTGLLPKQTACTSTSGGSGVVITTCDWDLPNKDVVNIVWGEISELCMTDWSYGSCNLGIPKGPGSDIFNNRNGWKFTTVSGNPIPGASVVRGKVPIAPKGGRLKHSGSELLDGNLNLDVALVTVDRLLDEHGGAGELARGTLGEHVAPVELISTEANRKDALFETPPEREPRAKLELKIDDGALVASLKVDRVIARDPALCAGLTPTTDLWTTLSIDDGFNDPVVIQVVEAWECREKKNGDRSLRAGKREREEDELDDDDIEDVEHPEDFADRAHGHAKAQD